MEKPAQKANHGQSFSLWQWLIGILSRLFGSKPGGGEMKTEVNNAAVIAEKNVQSNWNSLFNTMDYWVENRSILAEKVPSGMLSLSQEARFFAHQYSSFLSEVTIDPTEADEFSPTKLRSQALERVLEEWDTIRHALEQRENPRYQDTLVDLDQLAFECLSPLFDDKTLEKGVFAYFHKLFDIKRFVFSRTPLIGAPFSALHSPEDWLAIPHEVGHYIFWNGTKTFSSFNEFYLALQDQVVSVINHSMSNRITGRVFHHKGAVFQIWLNWMNEIFADVFGTLVAGPAFAWSMQSRLRAEISLRDLLHNHEDLEHPDPFIRPFFHIHTLREMAQQKEIDVEFANQLKSTADSLERSWRGSWPEDVTTRLPTPGSIGSMEQVLQEEVPGVVSVVLDAYLGENLPFSLREYFGKGLLYNSSFHQEVMQLAKQIEYGEKLTIDSPLKRGIAAGLAIVDGMNPIDVHAALGYPGAEETPAPNESLEQEFRQFLENVTGQTSREAQLKAFQRVLNYSLKEEGFHWHSHPHVDG